MHAILNQLQENSTSCAEPLILIIIIWERTYNLTDMGGEVSEHIKSTYAKIAWNLI